MVGFLCWLECLHSVCSTSIRWCVPPCQHYLKVNGLCCKCDHTLFVYHLLFLGTGLEDRWSTITWLLMLHHLHPTIVFTCGDSCYACCDRLSQCECPDSCLGDHCATAWVLGLGSTYWSCVSQYPCCVSDIVDIIIGNTRPIRLRVPRYSDSWYCKLVEWRHQHFSGLWSCDFVLLMPQKK